MAAARADHPALRRRMAETAGGAMRPAARSAGFMTIIAWNRIEAARFAAKGGIA